MVVFLLIMGVILGSAAVNGTMCLFWRGRVCCPMCSGGDDFVPRNRTGVKESLHRRLAKTPAPLMWPFLVVAPDPFIKIGLQGLDRSVELLAERDTVELVEDGLVKALDNAIRLWALRLGPRMVNVFHRESRARVRIARPPRHRCRPHGDAPSHRQSDGFPIGGLRFEGAPARTQNIPEVEWCGWARRIHLYHAPIKTFGGFDVAPLFGGLDLFEDCISVVSRLFNFENELAGPDGAAFH